MRQQPRGNDLQAATNPCDQATAGQTAEQFPLLLRRDAQGTDRFAGANGLQPSHLDVGEELRLEFADR